MTARSDAVAVVDEARRVTALFAELRAAPRGLRVSARQQALRAAAALRRQQLAQVPLVEVRPRLPKGTRFPVARLGERFGSLAELAAAEDGAVRAVPGVGPSSAAAIVAAAREIADEVAGQVTVRLDESADTVWMTRLVATLAAIRHADTVTDTARAVDGWEQRVLPLLAEADRARSWWRMLWCRPSRRRAARGAVAALSAALAEPRTRGLRERVARDLSGCRERDWSGGRAWEQYRADPEGFAALLACVGGSVCAGHPEAAGGSLPRELREEITSTEVDTRLLTARLLGYQVFGAQFALCQRRVILGDEMGLGKTMQALAAACHVLAENRQARVLVVCPAAVLWNWDAEVRAHTRLRPLLAHGPDRASAVRRWRRSGGILLTTFGTLGALRLPDTALCVVDEAHQAKNPRARRTQSVIAAAGQAQRVLFLTGTPMENRVSEFAALVSHLGAQVDLTRLASRGVSGAQRFRERAARVYLRRNQADVLTELPEAIYRTEWVELATADRAAHDAAAHAMRQRRATFGQAKRTRLAELVAKARSEDRKVVVFSFFRDTLNLIQQDLGELAVGPLSGDTSPRRRQQLVDEFSARAGTAVLLAQIGAGGTGLNIQAASMIILVEPQWTSTIEEQAVARAVRKGQQRRVLVHRLIARDSVDVGVREVQQGKAAQFEVYARTSAAAQNDEHATDTGMATT